MIPFRSWCPRWFLNAAISRWFSCMSVRSVLILSVETHEEQVEAAFEGEDVAQALTLSMSRPNWKPTTITAEQLDYELVGIAHSNSMGETSWEGKHHTPVMVSPKRANRYWTGKVTPYLSDNALIKSFGETYAPMGVKL
jgi:hypothetical protein